MTTTTQEAGTMITSPEGIQGVVVITIKQGLKARKIGMFITRGATTKFLLDRLSKITGRKYKRNDIEQGISDCEAIIAKLAE